MKQYAYVIAFLGLFAVATPAAAETATTAPDAIRPIKELRQQFASSTKDERMKFQEERKGIFGNLKDRRNELEESIKAKREAFKAEIETIKKEKATVRKSFVENRFSQVIVVLTNHQARLESKIDELEAAGNDMDGAQDHLDASKVSLKKATDLLTTLKVAVVSDTDNNSVNRPRAIAKEIEAALKETRMHLVETIKAIKAVINPEEDEEEDDEFTATTAN